MVLEDKYTFSILPGDTVSGDLLTEISDLFSAHYGIWDKSHSRLKGHVRLSAERIKKDYLLPESQVVLARERKSNMLVGYAVAIKKSAGSKTISWVTQFVVHKEHQNQGIGKNLLYSFWGESSLDAWGIVTSNPYAIRALEKATHRRCALQAIKTNKHWWFKFAIESISYINEDTEIIVNDCKSVINTQFFVDHSEITEKIEKISKDAPWILGTLDPGWEWFAFSFREQLPFPLSEEEIQNFLCTSDELTKLAYSKMDMSNQGWTKHTEHEIDFILKTANLHTPAAVLDIGCGTGRHGKLLAKLGYEVTAVDYNNYSLMSERNLDFIIADAREYSPSKKYSLVLCLYDVIGSFADDIDNEKIIETIATSLSDEGTAVISVMNIDFLMARQPNICDVQSDYNILFSIPAQNTMQTTGDIFNNSGICIDASTNVCYRREIFKGDESDIPREFIVRDRRYTMPQIIETLKRHGLTTIQSKYVKAGHWNDDFEPSEAKEILLFCKKSH